MKLNKIKISGIFNLKDVEISLDDLSALIAPNNYGKVMCFVPLISVSFLWRLL